MIFDFILIPLVACLLLILTNVYFGLHVIRREIIFIDIALAQIAAFGSTIAMIMFENMKNQPGHHSSLPELLAYLFSIGFVTGAAYFFSLFQNRKLRVSLEAIIGISYALATCATVIVLDASAGGDVHVHDMLVGSILWVTWHDVSLLFILVLLVGIFHFLFRSRFIELTESYTNAAMTIKNKKTWDFLFYLSLGLVIIQAVHMAGILTVFALLIIPASISTLLSGYWWPRLWIGWLTGFVVIAVGLYLSVKMDIPFSPVIIAILGAMVLIASIFKRFVTRKI